MILVFSWRSMLIVRYLLASATGPAGPGDDLYWRIKDLEPDADSSQLTRELRLNHVRWADLKEVQ